jgi:hypothetical protein
MLHSMLVVIETFRVTPLGKDTVHSADQLPVDFGSRLLTAIAGKREQIHMIQVVR